MSKFFFLRTIGSSLEVLVNIPLFLLSFALSKEERIKRKVKRTPRKSLREVKTGEYVQIVGKAERFDRSFVAPLSKRESLAYQTKVSKDVSDGRQENYVLEEILHRFYLVEGDKQILVIPNGAIADLKLVVSEDAGILANASDALQAFLKKHGTKAKSFGMNKTLEAREKILEQGQEVIVVGKVSVLNTRNQGKQTVIRHLEKAPLYIKAN
ncbi:MAG: hypothetical protein Crog4KO_19750 [Crocinitomicaceae bacterium]